VDSNIPPTVPLNREDRTFQLISSYNFEGFSSILTCSDDEDYKFLLGSGEKVGFGWLTQDKANAAKIITKYCTDQPIQEICSKSCPGDSSFTFTVVGTGAQYVVTGFQSRSKIEVLRYG